MMAPSKDTRRIVLVTVLLTMVATTVWAIDFGRFFRRRRSSGGSATQGQPITKMPGQSFKGELPPLTDYQTWLRDELKKRLTYLAGEIGARSAGSQPKGLAQAADYVEASFKEAGLKTSRQSYRAGGQTCHNIECEVLGSKRPKEIVLLGAHYDAVPGCPGANDNGSGTVALLALAKRLSDSKPDRTLRFVAFTNEEQPYFQSGQMGSQVYARRCRARNENIVAMVCLETIGYYSDQPGSQKYPAAFSRYYPSTGNFIGFVGNVQSATLVKRCVTTFRNRVKFPCEGGALPSNIAGVGWSDHWAFWQNGYQALMVTDTAPFRYPHYHRFSDTVDKINFDRMARVTEGVQRVIEELVKVPEEKAGR